MEDIHLVIRLHTTTTTNAVMVNEEEDVIEVVVVAAQEVVVDREEEKTVIEEIVLKTRKIVFPTISITSHPKRIPWPRAPYLPVTWKST
jgi:hypothetical protein